MGILTKLFNKKKTNIKNSKKNIYDSLGDIKPLTTLENNQLRKFITILSQSQNLNENEKKAFSNLLYIIYPNFDAEGNNIWNFTEGVHLVYKNEDVEIKYEKKSEDIEESYNRGSVNIVYKSNAGSFVINQNGRNKVFFLIYVSEYISDDLLKLLKEVESQVLELKKDNAYGKYRIYVGKIEGKKIVNE